MIAFTTVIFQACGNGFSKARYLESFRVFVAEIELHADEYTTEDWKENDDLFESYAEYQYQKYKYDLTEEENEEIGRLIARYVAASLPIRTDMYIEKLKEEYQNHKEVIRGFLKELSGDE